MTTEPIETAREQADVVSAIENEIPTYRAISPGAVASVICGVLAIFSFANWFFLVFAVLAIVLGFLTDRKIQRFPDILTGRGLSQAGIALGLVFGLTAVTIGTVQSMLIGRDAQKFALSYQKVLTQGSLEDAVFYNQPPNVRKGTTAAQLAKDLKAKSGDSPMIEMQVAPFRELKTRLEDPGAQIHFSKIETTNDDGRYRYAAALFEVHSPSKSDPEQKDTHALAVMKAMKDDKGVYEWWVEELRFPYKPATYVRPEKAPDDGHGHGEGEGHSEGDGHPH